jgi:hypothetical protein
MYDGFGYTSGIPSGETGRREHTTNATGMDDDHNNLGFLYSGTWNNDWNYPKCFFDPNGSDPDSFYGKNNWEGIKDSATQYHLEHGTGSC